MIVLKLRNFNGACRQYDWFWPLSVVHSVMVVVGCCACFWFYNRRENSE